MSVLGKVEMSPKIVPGATGDEDVEDCNEHHDEHARGRSGQDGAGPWSTECCRSGWRRSGWGLADVNSSGCMPHGSCRLSATTEGSRHRRERIVAKRHSLYGPRSARGRPVNSRQKPWRSPFARPAAHRVHRAPAATVP